MQNSWSYIPLWVYPLFFWLLFLGIRQCYMRRMKIYRLFILPIIFILMSFNNLDGSPKLNELSVSCWIAAIALGIYIGYLHKKNVPITIDRTQHIITIPGDWIMLLLIMVVFAVEFAINAAGAFGHSSSAWYAPLVLGVSGLATGMALGRNGTYLYRYYKSA